MAGQQRTWDGRRLQVEDRRLRGKVKEVEGSLPAAGRLSFVGSVLLVANNAELPDGWLECNGAAISRSNYPEAWDALGTTHGAGDGSTTFNIPTLVAPANHRYAIYVVR